MANSEVLWKDLKTVINDLNFSYQPGEIEVKRPHIRKLIVKEADTLIEELQEIHPEYKKTITQKTVNKRAKNEILESIMESSGNIFEDLRELEAIATVEELPYFLYLLESDNVPLKVETALALGRLGFKKAIEPMEEISGDENNELVQDAIEWAIVNIVPEAFFIREPVKAFLKRGEYVEVLLEIFDKDRDNFEASLMALNLSGKQSDFEFKKVDLIGKISKQSSFNKRGNVRFKGLPGGDYRFIIENQAVIRKAVAILREYMTDEEVQLLHREKVPVFKSPADEVIRPKELKWEVDTGIENLLCTFEVLPDIDRNIGKLHIVFEYECKGAEKVEIKYSLENADTDEIIKIKRGTREIPLEGTVELKKTYTKDWFKGDLYKDIPKKIIPLIRLIIKEIKPLYD